MARDMEIRDEGVWQSPPDREALREALLDGALSPAELAERWPGSDRQAALIRAVFEQFDEWGYDTGASSHRGDTVEAADAVSGCNAAVDRAREAVDNLAAQGQAEPDLHDRGARWRADEIAHGTGVELDFDGGEL
jgi:hypothetical protein